jgi:predicted GH43/DUF377 family glycosyl hydrolase
LYKPYLVKSEDTYYLFYNAKNVAKDEWVEQIGLATSKDLKSWNRHPENPIVPAGGPASWDSQFASDPCVVRHGKWWALYYYGLASSGRARDLLALSTDPRGPFTKVKEVFVDVGPPGSIDEQYAHKPSLIYTGSDLYHYYCAVSGTDANEVRGISVARSRAWT